MRDQISLALGGNTLTLHWSQAQRPHGWLARMRRRTAPQAASTQSGASHAVSLPVGQLGDTLDQAWTSVQKQGPQVTDGADLSVQLGLAYARLGLLHLAGDDEAEARATVIDHYVQAWIRQMWGVDPATQIIRWDRMENGHDLLISCIDRSVYAELEAFAQRHGLRFVSCKPAVLNTLESPPTFEPHSGAPCILVWTEPSATAKRSPLVQLLHSTGGQPSALWRGWLPALEPADTPDAALQGAIRRFSAAYSVQVDAIVVFRHWNPTLSMHEPVGVKR